MLSRFRLLLSVCTLVAGAAVTFTGTAEAGVLQIRDQAHVLSADDTARLRSVVMAAPFDGRLVVTTEYADAQDLSRYVGSLVAEANTVVVGLDPLHHHVQVQFGNGSRVPAADWPVIERAGNDSFRRSDWEGGVAAIFQSASSVVGSGGHAVPVASARPSFLSPGLLLVLIVGGIGLAMWFARRRASSYGPMGGGGYGPPPYGGQGYPMGPQQGGMGPLGGGLLGAGLGGLAGYEVGKLEGEREERDHDRGGDRGGFNDDRGGGGGFDAGGGGSDWDNGGGSGNDGGGGGGFDGGGGGSDF